MYILYIVFECPLFIRRSGAEQFYMDAGLQNVSELFLAAFSNSSDAGLAAITDEGNDGEVLDALALDESRQYKQKISKYIRSSLNCAKNSVFFAILLIGHKCREPLLHHYRFLNQKLTDTSMHLVEFVSTHMDTIQCEFEDLLVSIGVWATQAVGTSQSIPTCDPMTEVDRDYTLLAGLTILLHNAAAYNRRVLRVFNRQE